MKHLAIVALVMAMCLVGCSQGNDKPVNTPNQATDNTQKIENVENNEKTDNTNTTENKENTQNVEVKVNKPNVTVEPRDISDGVTKDFETKVDCISVEGKDFDSLNNTLETINNDRITKYTELYNEYKDLLSEGSFGQPFSIDSSIKLLRNDEVVLSFVDELYTNFGGAHPSIIYTGYNLDIKTGNVLTLSDVVSDSDKLCSIIKEMLSKHEYHDGFYDGYETMVNEYIINGVSDPDAITWYLTENSLVIYFNQGSLAPYAVGGVECELSYSEYGDILSQSYLPK